MSRDPLRVQIVSTYIGDELLQQIGCSYQIPFEAQNDAPIAKVRGPRIGCSIPVLCTNHASKGIELKSSSATCKHSPFTEILVLLLPLTHELHLCYYTNHLKTHSTWNSRHSQSQLLNSIQPSRGQVFAMVTRHFLPIHHCLHQFLCTSERKGHCTTRLAT